MTATSMQLTLAGLQILPANDFQSRLGEARSSIAELTHEQCSAGVCAPLPRRAAPVFQDAQGNAFLLSISTNGLVAHPIPDGVPSRNVQAATETISGTIASTEERTSTATAGLQAGFMPLNAMDAPPSADPFKETLATLATQFPQQLAHTMMSSLMQNMLLGGSAGNPLLGALGKLGIGDGLGAIMQGALGGLTNALPGGVAGPLAGVVGQLQSAGAVDGIIDGCFGGDAANSPFASVDLDAIATEALSSVSDQLMSMWQVSDDSPAAEQIAHHLVEKYKEQLKDAVTDPDGALDKLDKLMNGATSSATLEAAHVGSKDDKADVVVSGQSDVLAAGSPISRITDKLSPSGKIILEGVPMVQAGGLPVSRVTATTAVPSKIAKGTANVLVGGVSITIPPPPEPKKPKSAPNDNLANGNKSSSEGSGKASQKDSGPGSNDNAAHSSRGDDDELKAGEDAGGNDVDSEDPDLHSEVEQDAEFLPKVQKRRDEISERLRDPNISKEESDRLLNELSEIDRNPANLQSPTAQAQSTPKQSNVTESIRPDGTRVLEEKLPNGDERTTILYPNGIKQVTTESKISSHETDLYIMKSEEVIKRTTVERYDPYGIPIGREESLSAENIYRNAYGDRITFGGSADGGIDGTSAGGGASAGTKIETNLGNSRVTISLSGGEDLSAKPPVSTNGLKTTVDIVVGDIEFGREDAGYVIGISIGPIQGSINIDPGGAKHDY